MKQLENLTGYTNTATTYLKRYAFVVFVVIVGGAYGFLAYRISALTSTEPSQEVISEQLQTVNRPKIDQQAVQRMEQLEGENVETKAIFEEARSNPFVEPEE